MGIEFLDGGVRETALVRVRSMFQGFDALETVRFVWRYSENESITDHFGGAYTEIQLRNDLIGRSADVDRDHNLH